MNKILEAIDRIPLKVLIVLAVFLAIAPIVPEPHLQEKLRMLVKGELSRPIDIFDLIWHSFLLVLLVIRLVRLKNRH